MNKILLSNQITFSIEPFEKKVRLVVYKDNKEWVCRKETFKNLNYFLSQEDVSIFKGRLQLHKRKNKINVEVKGEIIGVINADVFRKSIQYYMVQVA